MRTAIGTVAGDAYIYDEKIIDSIDQISNADKGNIVKNRKNKMNIHSVPEQLI